jgi:hypothetical protein
MASFLRALGNMIVYKAFVQGGTDEIQKILSSVGILFPSRCLAVRSLCFQPDQERFSEMRTRSREAKWSRPFNGWRLARRQLARHRFQSGNVGIDLPRFTPRPTQIPSSPATRAPSQHHHPLRCQCADWPGLDPKILFTGHSCPHCARVRRTDFYRASHRKNR